MKNRPRPPISIDVKLRVAADQLLALRVNVFAKFSRETGETKAQLLERRLVEIARVRGCPRKDLRLDHDPALRVRAFDEKRFRLIVKKAGRWKRIAACYSPNANDPDYLTYRPHAAEFEGSHHVKTNIRGDHGQFSDRVLIKRERKREKLASQKAAKVRLPKRKRRPMGDREREISSRSGRIAWAVGRSRWPQGRKLQSRPFQNRSRPHK